MAIITSIAVGNYAVSYTPAGGSVLAAGCTEGPIRHRQRQLSQPVRCDAYAETEVDGIYTGIDMRVVIVFKEWVAATKAIFWPWDTEYGQLGLHGRLLSDMAGVLLLTAQTDSAAYNLGPRTRTYHKAILAPGQDLDIPMGNVQRDMPVAFQIFPVFVGSTSELKHFTDTQPS